MSIANLTNLPEDILKSEFPQIWMKMQQQKMSNQVNSDKTNIFLDQDNNQFYLQKDKSQKATRYNLLNLNKTIPRPQYTDDTHLSADYMISNWGALDDQNIFDSTNHNWDEIRSYLERMTNKVNNQTDFLLAIGPYLDELAKEKDVDLSEITADGINGYYDKKHTDDFELDIKKRMKNIENKFPDQPIANGYFPPNYTGNNDDSDDPDLDSQLQRMNNEIEEANK
ncbi:hypothetical protein [Companilactobacillus nantensis]|uniref:Uncharacterized protein n=1 Tax=Companilactobacillus nantensis DSM 16982 TaxID=1423774 RepID=A0A0R1WRV4_9LACO|nr:hypothetical protein [Companilactobacillus nantensis]KRM18473.1 hypothetical protein FD31_GL001021 [Companilactobacillus nantensis DSM 16982]GEO63045.1 hypothetical protein LNA01_02280 [Companilactobacillus nantensis]